MIKKINAILLSLLLVLPTVGVSIEKHFCGGNLSDVALFTGAGCGCDEANETDDCCREEDQVLRVDLDQFGSSVQRVPEIAQQDVLICLAVMESLIGEASEASGSYFYDLPPPKAVPFYKMNCSLTFYA
jgi:hypothetical protein